VLPAEPCSGLLSNQVTPVAIIRSYKLGPTTPPPDRRPLGRLRVTLDDMRALMQLLDDKRWSGDAGDVVPPSKDSNPVLVAYDEGLFTAAEDMKELSDTDLRNLQVKCDQTTVYLSPSRAEAIGPASINDLIENAWARSLQTPKRPKPRRTWLSVGYALVGALFGVYAIFSWLFLSDAEVDAFLHDYPVAEVVGGTALAFLFLGPTLSLLFDVELFTSRPKNYALIVPFTQDELRKQERSRSKWPIISATIAALALVVSLTFNVINLLRH
jgi:hypothetical protein